MSEGLRLGGQVPFSTVDYPGALTAVLFCQGCPWQCRYCHNAHLQPTAGEGPVWADVLAWLGTRRGLLEAVVFSGGEPTGQAGLGEAMARVRDLGFRVGLHTAGCHPERLRELLPLTDWVGLDLKGPRSAYPRLTGRSGSAELAWRSLDILRASGVPFQLRTTVHPDWISQAELAQLQAELAAVGLPPSLLQPGRPPGG